MKKFTKEGFTVRQTKDGYTVTLKNWSGSYKEHCATVDEVDCWIQNMADKGGHYERVNARLNEVFKEERDEEERQYYKNLMTYWSQSFFDDEDDYERLGDGSDLLRWRNGYSF